MFPRASLAAKPREVRLVALTGVPLIGPGDDLAAVIRVALEASGERLQDGDILVLAQKIVSKTEGRQIHLADVQPSTRAIELAAITGKDPRIVELVLRESTDVLRAKRDVLVVSHRLGFVMANAGVDQSNIADADETALLLPINPDESCLSLRTRLQEQHGVALAVVMNDSHGRAWRNGAVGVCIGAAGLAALLDLRGEPDLFGRELKITEVGHADEIASAASMLMGQAGEGSPIVLCRGLAPTGTGGRALDLVRPRHVDLFR